MNKIAAGLLTGGLLLGICYLFPRAQVRQTQQSTAKATQVRDLDLLKRIQTLEREIAELKKVIEIDGPSVKIKARGSLIITSATLDLNSTVTRAANMPGKITFGLKVLEGTAPMGPAIIPIPQNISVTISK